jgi:hypothetical protein
VNAKAGVEVAAVAASAPVTLATAGISATLVSLSVGLIGVWLARIVFVSRENRRLEKPTPFLSTLPVTLAACLIAGAVIWDQHLGISASVFVGLGTGWTTVLILEFAGDRLLNSLRVLMGGEAHPVVPLRPQNQEVYPNVPDDMADLLRQADEVDPQNKPPSQ